jgi:3'-phosphoadenosine 5'-phosphosulfate sulfotransferase (PAPS reductase)/FAD synthetase
MTETSPRPAVDFARLESHKNIVLLFSGGKDSLALVNLFRPYWDRITLLHCDTGDLLPEVHELVSSVEKAVPHFVRIETNAPAWIAANGLPSDLVPVRSNPIGLPFFRGGRHPIVTIFDCCDANRWKPWRYALELLSPSLVMNGQRRSDSSGWNVTTQGDERTERDLGYRFWFPIADWSDDDVFAYLREIGAPILRFYSHRLHAPECATCPASWGEGRAAYLRTYHPDLADRYASYLRIHAAETVPILEQFMAEWRALGLGSTPSSQAEFD